MENNKNIEKFDYQYFSELINQIPKMKCEEIIEIHKSLIGKKYKDDNYIGDYGRYFIFKLLDYDYGYSIAKAIPKELTKFFNSKHTSDYFKQMIKENVETPSQIVLNAINSERNFNEFTEEEFYTIENDLNAAGFHNIMFSLAFKLDSKGASNFLNNKIEPPALISRIVLTSGLSDRPEYYSGRGAKMCDLNGKMLISIYNKLKKIDKNKALSMAKMTLSMPTLGATEFLESLYRLAYNNYNLEKTIISTNNNSLGTARGRERKIIGMGIIAASYSSHRIGDTDAIKSDFLYYLPSEITQEFYQTIDLIEEYDYSRIRKR